MAEKTIYTIQETIEIYEISEGFVLACIEKQWVNPCSMPSRGLDMEDIARLLLIQDLKEDFGVNDEAVPIILHLIDQIHWLKERFNKCLDSVLPKES